MQLTHSFTVPAPVDEAFAVLRDIERIAPCMPGATLGEVDGDEFTGKVTVKVGPIQVTYQGKARFVEVHEGKYRAVLKADATQVRGRGTARARIPAECRDRGKK
ncbi:MAG: SRPBCC family protein, partial [Egibacteraceae bacterium]